MKNLQCDVIEDLFLSRCERGRGALGVKATRKERKSNVDVGTRQMASSC